MIFFPAPLHAKSHESQDTYWSLGTSERKYQTCSFLFIWNQLSVSLTYSDGTKGNKPLNPLSHHSNSVMIASNPIKSTSDLRCVVVTQLWSMISKLHIYMEHMVWNESISYAICWLQQQNQRKKFWSHASDPIYIKLQISATKRRKKEKTIPPPCHVTNQTRELIWVKINSANKSENLNHKNHKGMQVRQILPFSKGGDKGLGTWSGA